MYEGKNLHFSPADKKPLCSFSNKLCKQRRINGYGFCVRHILEDPHAPFRRCAYVAKSSKQTCTQPIPIHEEREFCNNHMQVLGMLPKKERKPKKEKVVSPAGSGEPFVLQNPTKTELSGVHIKKQVAHKRTLALDDPEDPYAFPADPVQEPTRLVNHVTSMTVSSGETTHSSANVIHTSTLNQNKSPGDSPGSSSLAKMYPELAEKLEKIKPKAEVKLKGKVKSSVTMNSLQTKIAQNKIKDKLKRSQESSSTSSQSQSPCHSFSANSPGKYSNHSNNASSPGFHSVNSPVLHSHPINSPIVQHTASSPVTAGTTNSPLVSVSPSVVTTPAGAHSHSLNQTQMHVPAPPTSITSAPAPAPAPAPASQGLPRPPVPQINLNALSLNPFGPPLNLPLPPDLSILEQTFQHLAKAIDGAFQAEGAPGTPAGGPLRLPPPFLPELLGIHHLLRPPLVPPAPPPPYPSLPQRPTLPLPTPPVIPVTTPLIPFIPAPPSSLTSPVTLPNMSQSQKSQSPITTPATMTSSPSTVTATITSSTPVTTSTRVTNTHSAVSPVLSQAKSSKSSPKTSSLKIKSTPTSTVSKTNRTAVPIQTPVCFPSALMHPKKVKNVLLETEMEKKFKTKSAIRYYGRYVKRKIYDHNYLYTGFSSSEDSDSADCDTMPWQPDWFTASSDEDPNDDDEEEDDLRTAKLGLIRARLRRQGFQCRKSYRANCSVRGMDSSSALALIESAREKSAAAVKSLWEIHHITRKPLDKYLHIHFFHYMVSALTHKFHSVGPFLRFKFRGLEKRQCCYKNDEEVQCPNRVVPYTNHCIKHVMYNVDQQLFDYCTAKFADNTQCCVPVIDIKHELPLCMEHGIKADNYQKTQENEPKAKRPRKKTKPSALTRPPKKGKKKKNLRKQIRPQEQLPLEEPMEDAELAEAEEESMVTGHEEEEDEEEEEDNKSMTPPPTKPVVDLPVPAVVEETKKPVEHSLPSPSPPLPAEKVVVEKAVVSREHPSVVQRKVVEGPIEQPEDLENLSALPELGNLKSFGDLPLEQASKLLEENDFQEVFNRLPDEAFDIFGGKNGEPTSEEVEELERSLALANNDLRSARDNLDKFSYEPAAVPPILEDADELTKQIAEEILSQNLVPDANIGSSLCNGDAQESIKAIARSLSSSGMLLDSQGGSAGMPETGVSGLRQASPAALNFIGAGQAHGQVIVGQGQNQAAVGQGQRLPTDSAAVGTAPASIGNVSLPSHGVVPVPFAGLHNNYSAETPAVPRTLGDRISNVLPPPPGLDVFHDNQPLPQQLVQQLIQLQQTQQQLTQQILRQSLAQQQLPHPQTPPPQSQASATNRRPVAVATVTTQPAVFNTPSPSPVTTPVSHAGNWIPSTGVPLTFPNGFPLSSVPYMPRSAISGVKFTMRAPLPASDLKQEPQVTHYGTSGSTSAVIPQVSVQQFDNVRYPAVTVYKSTTGSGS